MKGPGQGGEGLRGVVLGMGQNVTGQIGLDLPQGGALKAQAHEPVGLESQRFHRRPLRMEHRRAQSAFDG